MTKKEKEIFSGMYAKAVADMISFEKQEQWEWATDARLGVDVFHEVAVKLNFSIAEELAIIETARDLVNKEV